MSRSRRQPTSTPIGAGAGAWVSATSVSTLRVFHAIMSVRLPGQPPLKIGGQGDDTDTRGAVYEVAPVARGIKVLGSYPVAIA